MNADCASLNAWKRVQYSDFEFAMVIVPLANISDSLPQPDGDSRAAFRHHWFEAVTKEDVRLP